MSRGRLRTARIGLPLTVVATAIGLAVCANHAEGQKPPFSTFQVQQSVKADADFGAAQSGMIDQYFGQYFFPLFVKPVRSDDLPNWRMKIFKVIVRDVGKTKGHDYLNALMLKQLTKIFPSAKYDNAVRYNAMLLVGELNENDDSRGMKPHPDAYALLIKVLTLKDRPDLDFLKPAALVGMARIAEEGGIPKEKAGEASDLLLALVTTKDPPPGRSTSAHNFLRRRAAEVLALMGSPGPQNSVLKAFEAMMSDPQSNLLTRCEMARFIGMLKYPPGANAELQRLAGLLGHQAVDLYDAEVARTAKQRNTSRRYLMYVLESSGAGLEGLGESAERGSETQKFIGGLEVKTTDLLKTLADLDETKEPDVAAIAAPEIDKIRALLPEKGTAIAPAEGPLVATGKEEPAKQPGAN